MKYLTLDVGTTCCKTQLFDETGEILFYRTKECPLMKQDGQTYVDIDGIASSVKDLIRDAADAFPFDSIAVSSFGEAFVTLDKDDNFVTYPMLYTDPRGKEEAEFLGRTITPERLFRTTGTTPNPMYSVSKLLYIKNHAPERFRKIDKCLLICDYIGYLLTGKRVIDYSLAARTGVFDIRKKAFASDILEELGIPAELFSAPEKTGSIVGKVLPEVAEELHMTRDCLLVLGSHDQVCATIGTGVIDSGASADGMGTVECMTAVFDEPPGGIEFGNMGYCVVPFLGHYCTYMFNYTSNVIVNWFRNGILHGYSGGKDNQFAYLESGNGPTNVLVLPYFAGCATPYQDTDAKGAILNLTKETTDTDIYRAILESTAYEMRLNAEVAKKYGIDIFETVATGGGANSGLWLQIKADIQHIPVRTLRSSEGGLCGCAMLSAVALGSCRNLADARNIFVRYKDTFVPSTQYKATYEKKYEKYKNLYQKVKEFF